MESVLFSISFGKQHFASNKVTYQAFSAAISSQSHVDLVMQYVQRKERILKAKCKVLAYRVTSQRDSNMMDQMSDQYSQQDPLNDQSIHSQSLLTEGFDDGGEEGCGQKLLHLLQKMGVENILIIVCVWHQRMNGQFGTDTYRIVIERAKDLLTSLHLKVLEAEKQQQEQQRMTQMMVYKEKSIQNNKRSTMRQGLQQAGMEVTTKVYPSTIIPDRNIKQQANNMQRKNYRPNNFMNEAPTYGAQRQGFAGGSMGRTNIEDDQDETLEIDLTEDEFNYAVKMTDHSIRRLTKSHLIDLRSQVKPHPLVEKVLNMVCILRGCIAPNWTVSREMMGSMTFKMELMLMDVCQIKSSLIKRVIKVLNSNQKNLTPDTLSQISEGATILLTWIINLVKWNAGHTKYKFDENALGGHKIMNHALIASGDNEGDENQFNTEEDNQKDNKYGLMIGNTNNDQYEDRQANRIQSQAGKTIKRQMGAHINPNINQQVQKPGVYIQSKQMVFGSSQKLQPGRDSNMSNKGHFSSQQSHSDVAPTLQNQLVKQYQQNNPQVNDKQQIQNMIDMLQADKKNNWEELRARIPDNEEEILRFLDSAVLEDQPTEVLVQLAQKLKERRTKLQIAE